MSIKSKLLGELKERKMQLSDEIFKLSKEKNIFNVEVDRLRKQVDAINGEIKEHKEELDYLNQEINERKQLVGYLEHKVKEKEEIIQKYDIQIDGDKSIIDNLESGVLNTKKYEIEFENGTKKTLRMNEFSLAPEEMLLMQVHFTDIDEETYKQLQEDDENIWSTLSDNYPFHIDYRVYNIKDRKFNINLHMDLEEVQDIDLLVDKFNKCESFWLEPKDEDDKYSYMALIWN